MKGITAGEFVTIYLTITNLLIRRKELLIVYSFTTIDRYQIGFKHEISILLVMCSARNYKLTEALTFNWMLGDWNFHSNVCHFSARIRKKPSIASESIPTYTPHNHIVPFILYRYISKRSPSNTITMAGLRSNQ